MKSAYDGKKKQVINSRLLLLASKEAVLFRVCAGANWQQVKHSLTAILFRYSVAIQQKDSNANQGLHHLP